MTTARYLNGSLFIKFEDGDFVLTTCDKEFAEHLVTLINEGASKEELLVVLNPEFKQLQEEVEKIQQENQKVESIVESVLTDERFYLNEGKLYRQGIPLSIPRILTEKIQECVQNSDQEQLDRLDRFWAWCSLIKNMEVRESFYTYITKNKLILTKEGFVVGYRRAHKVATNSGLADFVGLNYNRLIKNKKSTTVDVYECVSEEGITYSLKPLDKQKCRVVGTLKDLFKNPALFEDVYHSNHKDIHGNPVVYRIGVETRLKDEEVDWNPNMECSRGIHGHLGNYNDGNFGNTRFFFVVNPMDVASCPYADSSKFRMAALTPIGIMGTEQEDMDDFVLTEDIEEIIQNTMKDHLKRLEQINDKVFEDSGHTLLKEVPNFSIKNLFTTINEVVNNNIVKERYTKL